MIRRAKLWIGGEWVEGEGTFEVADRFTAEPLAMVDRASRDQVNAAVAAAHSSFQKTVLIPYERFEILQRASVLLEGKRPELISTITAESGFTISDATAEVNRAVQTLLLSAEEAKRIHGEMVPVDGAPGQSQRMAFTIRVPRGVVCAITPFNSPLNTVAHKIAPALAAGNTVVLKPASYTPLTGLLLCETLLEAGLPPAHINLVNGPGAQIGRWLGENPDVRFYAFTGSTAVGRALRAAAGLRPASLELGSISSTIVCEDADLERAVPRCINAAFRKAGQVCTSVQRLYVHASIAVPFTRMLVERARAAKTGDPRDPKTLVGPMISIGEAQRAECWVQEAVATGAKLLLGGARNGPVLSPTILSDVCPEMKVMCEEIFAPVISIIPYESFDDAIAQVNNTCYGLAAGVFTRDLNRAMTAVRRLQMGSVHINETSSSRVDLMPYSGAKDSGSGREGPKYAIEEMTEERLITLSLGA
jgi:succinate-semialdehyde dehydrogenase/glutarate-semialdehyde dehydrogenase